MPGQALFSVFSQTSKNVIITSSTDCLLRTWRPSQQLHKTPPNSMLLIISSQKKNMRIYILTCLLTIASEAAKLKIKPPKVAVEPKESKENESAIPPAASSSKG